MWDIDGLRMLRELQLRGTITAVARALSYSPSTVSQRLAQLERQVGFALLEPDGRRVRLTGHGVLVARHAADVMDDEERTRAELAALVATAQTVRLTTLETAARALLPVALGAIARDHPRIRVEATVLPPELGLFELEARRFDLAITEQYPGHTRQLRPGLDRRRLGIEQLRLAVPADSPIRSLRDAAALPWVFEPPGTAVRQWAVQQCRAAGFEPDVRYESADLVVHIRLVAAGQAVSVLPDLVWAGESAKVRLIPLPGAPHRELFTSTRTASAGDAAVEAVRDALAAAFDAREARP